MQSLQDASKGAAVADCARAVLDVVPVVMRPLRQQMRSHRAAGLSVPQFRALCFVDRYEGASLSAVAEHLDLSLPAVSRLVDGLVQRGYMQRRNSADDRRHIALTLRARGIEVMRAARKATQEFLIDRFNILSGEQRRAIVTAMQALRDLFELETPQAELDDLARVRASRGTGFQPVRAPRSVDEAVVQL